MILFVEEHVFGFLNELMTFIIKFELGIITTHR